MRDETKHFEAVAQAPQTQGREIDVRREVLLAGCSVEVFVGAVVGIGEDGAGHVMSIEQVGSFVAVVDGEDEAALEAASDFGDPVAGFEASFRVLAILEGDLLGSEILRDGASGERHGKFSETRAIAGDENFGERILQLKNAVNGQRVEEFVGEDAAHRNASGDFDGHDTLPFPDKWGEAGSELIATRRRAFHRNIAKALIKLRQAGLSELEDVASETTNTGASFDEEKFRGTIQLAPHFSELAGEQAAENGMDIDAGVVVGETLRFSATVIAMHRVVETLAHIFGEGDGPKTTNALGEERSERVHAGAAPEARVFWSCCQMSWKTS